MAFGPACAPAPGAPFSMPAAAVVERDFAPEPSDASGTHAFPRRRRLLRPHQFQHVFRSRDGRRAHGRFAVCTWAPNGRATARLGLVVSKRALRRSAARNRFKRQAREYFRLHPLPGVDVVIACRRGLQPPLNRAAVRADFDAFWKKIRL